MPWPRKSEGAATYQGRPCRRCGGTLRYQSGRNCVPCARSANKERSRARRAAA